MWNTRGVFEGIFLVRLHSFSDCFSDYGFCNKYSTQHTLIAMIEKARKIVDKGGTFGARLRDLSKTFDCKTHYFFIAKLHALNFDMNARNLIFDYLTRRKERVKINSSLTSYLDIFQGVPQGSILGPLLFNLFPCDLFLFVEEADIMFCADDNIPYVCSEHLDVTLERKTRGSRKSTF